MKQKLLLIFVMCVSYANAQKQNIDVDLLSNIISAKQDELKTRVLSNIVVKNIQTTNYTTYNTIYNLVDVITTEKNKTVMTQSILHQIADYSIVVGIETYFFKNNLSVGTQNTLSKTTGDNKDFKDFVANAYSYTVKDGMKEQDEKSKAPKINGIDPLLLNDFLIDTLYQMLSTNTFLTGKGFFKQDHQRPFFASGLDIDYSSIRSNANFSSIMTQLTTFVATINANITSANDVFTFIKDDKVQFNDFSQLKKEQIAFLLKLFDVTINAFREQIGQNNFIAVIGDIMDQYHFMGSRC